MSTPDEDSGMEDWVLTESGYRRSGWKMAPMPGKKWASAAGGVPPEGAIWFGGTYQARTLALDMRFMAVGIRERFAMVAHLRGEVYSGKVVFQSFHNGMLIDKRVRDLPGQGNIWAFSAVSLGEAGQWRCVLSDPHGGVLASGEIQVDPRLSARGRG